MIFIRSDSVKLESFINFFGTNKKHHVSTGAATYLVSIKSSRASVFCSPDQILRISMEYSLEWFSDRPTKVSKEKEVHEKRRGRNEDAYDANGINWERQRWLANSTRDKDGMIRNSAGYISITEEDTRQRQKGPIDRKTRSKPNRDDSHQTKRDCGSRCRIAWQMKNRCDPMIETILEIQKDTASKQCCHIESILSNIAIQPFSRWTFHISFMPHRHTHQKTQRNRSHSLSRNAPLLSILPFRHLLQIELQLVICCVDLKWNRVEFPVPNGYGLIGERQMPCKIARRSADYCNWIKWAVIKWLRRRNCADETVATVDDIFVIYFFPLSLFLNVNKSSNLVCNQTLWWKNLGIT